jgi:hypothetical protein
VAVQVLNIRFSTQPLGKESVYSIAGETSQLSIAVANPVATGSVLPGYSTVIFAGHIKDAVGHVAKILETSAALKALEYIENSSILPFMEASVLYPPTRNGPAPVFVNVTP